MTSFRFSSPGFASGSLRAGLAAMGLLVGLARVGSAPADGAPAGFSLREYRDFAMGRDGDRGRGGELFRDERRLACAQCHTVDGSATKAGPDLLAVGDKLSRRELIRAVLEPSAGIAVGYGTTTVELDDGEIFEGVVKRATGQEMVLLGADGQPRHLPVGRIRAQRGSTVSLMPEGLQAGLSRAEFTDLIEYLVSLRQPENALSSSRGLPAEIRELVRPVPVEPFLEAPLRYPETFVHKPGDVRSGLLWFGAVPGTTNVFLAVHQTGRIWRVAKGRTNDVPTLFLNLAEAIFNERGPNGLLGLAFHPRFVENRKYYLKHQVFEGGRILTTVVEREVLPDLSGDAGRPSRRLWQVASSTQDHSGGGIGFGPDGFLYIAMGDTGPQQDPEGHGQDLTTHLGKILRLDVDRTEDGRAYAIPADNPYRATAAGKVLPEIWASGFREPWRFSFDSLTGDLWVGDVGQDRVEEVALVRRGENHGWNVYEGFEPFSSRFRKDDVTYVPPVFAYRRKFGNSITGGHVYRGNPSSSFYGVYICGDFTSRRIFGLRQKDRVLEVVRQIGTSPQFIASFAVDTRGEIYVVGYEGMVYRLNLAATTFE